MKFVACIGPLVSALKSLTHGEVVACIGPFVPALKSLTHDERCSLSWSFCFSIEKFDS